MIKKAPLRLLLLQRGLSLAGGLHRARTSQSRFFHTPAESEDGFGSNL
jgi:hypothetical protein